MTTEKPDDPFESTRMSLGDHLEELRGRLVRSALVFVVAFVLAWVFRVEIAEFVRGPFERVVDRLNDHLVVEYTEIVDAHPERWKEFFTTEDPETRELAQPIDSRLLVTDVGEQFVFALNLSIGFALFLGSPFFLWQMWQFIAAGLYSHEKRGVRKAFPFSVGLFLAGVLFSFYVVVPMGMYFLQITLDPTQVETNLKLGQYFRFIRTMCLSMGVVFQLPILMIFASRFGLIRPATFGRYRGHWVVGALIIAALLTPGPDFYSQVLMAVPMIFLYEVGIQIGRMVEGARSTEETSTAEGAS